MIKHQQTLSAGRRVYYLDVRIDSNGTDYITIAEMNTRTKKRSCIYIYPEHVADFVKVLQEASENVSKS